MIDARIAVAAAAVAVGTYLLRCAGLVAPRRFVESERARRIVEDAATLMLVGVAAIGTIVDGHGFAGWDRVAGVAVAGVLAWRRAPLVIVVLVAAAVTGLLRALI